MATELNESRRATLSEREKHRLGQLEEIIDQGLETFIEVGRALAEIRDRRLYRAEFDTFDRYCRERWGIGRHYAYRQIRAADAVEVLENVDSCQQPSRLPANEAQARPLTSLDPPAQRTAWARAVEIAGEEQPTSSQVRQAIEELTDGAASSTPNGSEPDDADKYKNPHFSSQSNDWQTPEWLVRSAEQVLGKIDLDPCCSDPEDPAVPADRHFTEESDGLSRAWHGRVYLNPPYGREIGDWLSKLIAEYEAGRVSEAVALLPARTDTRWFRQLRTYPRCFLHGRLTFAGAESCAPFPSMTLYMGQSESAFVDEFSEHGDIYVHVSTNG